MAAERDGWKKLATSEGLKRLDNPLVRLYRRSRAEGFGPEVKRRIMLGTYALTAGYYDAYYLKALKVRRLIRDDFDAAFGEVDLIVGPGDDHAGLQDRREVGRSACRCIWSILYTVSANLAGIGGIAFPCGFSSGGLPIGLQLQGRRSRKSGCCGRPTCSTGDRLAHAFAAAVSAVV